MVLQHRKDKCAAIWMVGNAMNYTIPRTNTMVRQATLDDWPNIKKLWGEFQGSRHKLRITGTQYAFESYFVQSLTSSELRFFLALEGNHIMAFAIVHSAESGTLHRDESTGSVTFMRAMWAKPGITKELARTFQDLLHAWSRAKGHSWIVGQCCPDFPFKAYERLHGIRPLYMVVGKEVQ